MKKSSSVNDDVSRRAMIGIPFWMPIVLSFLFFGSASAFQNRDNWNAFPTFSIQELQTHQRQAELQETLASTGLLAVQLSDDTSAAYSHNRQTALQGLCECHAHPDFLSMEQTRYMMLQDDATQRTSVGTATVGMQHPLPLPNSLENVCGPETFQAMETLRDSVADVSNAFVVSMEQLLKEYTNEHIPLLKDKHGGKKYETLSSIVESANHLEHFHVYSKEARRSNMEREAKDTSAAAWDWHTDAGLFLVFVPALNCLDEDAQDTSFWYRNAQGEPVQAHFDGTNTAIVMLGQGAEDWLNMAKRGQSNTQDPPRLKATVHSVRWDDLNFMPQEQSSSSLYRHQRSWYGMMYLVPETAMIYGTKTLKDFRTSLSWSSSIKGDVSIDNDTMALGCGSSDPNFLLPSQFAIGDNGWDVAPSRRRMQHQDPSACNNVTNFFCWMQCLEIPSANQAQGYVNEGYSLYCLDPAVLASTGRVSDAAAPCEAGFVHNANCLGIWEPTAPGVPTAKVNVTADPSEIDMPFCYSGTTMVCVTLPSSTIRRLFTPLANIYCCITFQYMDGFHFFQSTTCIIFLFQSWILDSAGKYAVAFLGTLLLGVSLEKIIQQRRKYMASMGGGYQRLLFSASFYGIQLSIGYMLMLVIMIYSGAFFIATVMGLVFGHVFFNAKDAIWPLKAGATTLVIPPDDDSDSVSYPGEPIDDLDRTLPQEVEHDRPVELTEFTREFAITSGHEKDSSSDAVQNVGCCGKGQGGGIATDPGDALIPEGSTPCCQYSSCD